MKEMSAHQQGMSFYGNMPDQYTLVVNVAHPAIATALADINAATAERTSALRTELETKQQEENRLREEQKGKKDEELTQEQKDAVSAVTKEAGDLRKQIKDVYAEAAKQNATLSQLIDIALLASGRLQGEALAKFVDRSISLLGK